MTADLLMLAAIGLGMYLLVWSIAQLASGIVVFLRGFIELAVALIVAAWVLLLPRKRPVPARYHVIRSLDARRIGPPWSMRRLRM